MSFATQKERIGLAAFVRPMSDTRPKSNSIIRYRNYQYASDLVTFFEYRTVSIANRTGCCRRVAQTCRHDCGGCPGKKSRC